MPIATRAERLGETIPHRPPAPRTPPLSAPAQLLALQRTAGNAAVARMLAPTRSNILQRKGEGVGGGTATGEVGIPGGETATPSDQSALAPGYSEREDGQYDTPDGRVVSDAQAADESKVVNSDGIYMAAYLARYDDVRFTYGLTDVQMDKLSAAAGFMKQFKTGDVVLRLMDANDSAAIAKITDSHYSHSGIVQVDGGRVWVLDSYPAGTTRADATEFLRFEDFFADHHGEKVVNGLVLRIEGITDKIRADISALIDKYELKDVWFDFAFRIDNGDGVLYCSELVYRILQEASVAQLPPNEFAQTHTRVEGLIAQLEFLISMMQSQGKDTGKEEGQLLVLKSKLADMKAATDPQLFSPGSLERSGMSTVAGFTREGEVQGMFKVTVVSGTVPADALDTPDPFVIVSGGVKGQTPVQDDTVSPVWNTTFAGISYNDLNHVTFKVRDSDLAFDDDIATMDADLRPVRPAGQTFELSSGSTTLAVKVEGEGDAASVAGQAVRETAPM